MSTLTAGASPGWMVVRLGVTRVALPIEVVGEVLPIPEMSPVPMAPEWVAGIVSVRGEVVPVIDTARRLLARSANSEGRLVLISTGTADERAGLLVDGVVGLVERADADPREGAGEKSEIAPAFVAATVASGRSARVPVLDLSALLDPAVVSPGPPARASGSGSA